MRCGPLHAGVCLSFALVLATSAVRAQEPAAPAQNPPPAPPEPPPPPPTAEPPPPPPAPPNEPVAPPPEPAPPVTAPWPADPAPPAAAPAPAPAAPAPPPPSAKFPASPAAPPPKRPATDTPNPASPPAAAPVPSTGAAPAPAPPPKEKSLPEEEREEPKDDSYGVFGPFRIGPVLSFGLPSLLGFGGMVKLTRYFGAGANVGIIPEVKFSYYGEAKVSYQEYSLYGHIHPFGGGFFLGAQVGYARVKGSYATNVDLRGYSAMFPGIPERLSYTSRATVQTLVLTPEIGYFHIFGSGFSVGLDSGLQIPIAPSEITFERGPISGIPAEISNQAFAPYDQKVRTTLEKVGKTILPAFHFRVGFLL
jgi:hypothetical protein